MSPDCLFPDVDVSGERMDDAVMSVGARGVPRVGVYRAVQGSTG